MTRRDLHQSPHRRVAPLRTFVVAESAGAVLLVIAAVGAIVWASSPWGSTYVSTWKHLRSFVDDGLMSLFFLVVGLEIKRELTSGHLAARRAAILPFMGALGGMVVPALLYLSIAGGSAPHGWAIPMATDIALAGGLLGALGSRVPGSLRAFVLGLAIVDDIGAIIVIAAFYAHDVHAAWLLVAGGAIAGTALAGRSGVRSAPVYVALGAAMWFGLHQAGVHPTLAGVAMGVLVPAAVITPLERVLLPLTGLVIVPLFALASSGIALSGHVLGAAFGTSITWGIIVGLVIGKPLGVLVASAIAVRTGAAVRPSGATRRQSMGVGAVTGIGYTVAIFVAELAFTDERQRAAAKIGILSASVLAAAISALLLARPDRHALGEPSS